MPGHRIRSLLFFFLFGTAFLCADETDRFVVQPAVSFSQTKSASRPQSQIHEFRDSLTAQPPTLAVQRPTVVTAELKSRPQSPQQGQEEPEIRQVAVMAEPEKREPSQPKLVLTATEPELPATESQTESPAIDDKEESDTLLGKAIGFGVKDKAKSRKLERPQFSAAIAPVVSVIGSLLIVLSVFFILMMVVKKISPKGNRLLPKEAFEDLGRTFLTQKLQLHLLRLGNRLILVSVTPDGVSPITEVTDPDEVVPLLGMCRKLDENSSTELFRKMYSTLTDEDDPGRTPPKKQTPVPGSMKGNAKASTLVDLYSEPDESLADILASGLGKGGRNG